MLRKYCYFLLIKRARLGDCTPVRGILHFYVEAQTLISIDKASDPRNGAANMTLKDAIASCLVIALGIILIIHFALFWVYGGVFIYESNKIILTLETIMSVLIIGFGFERLLSSSFNKLNKKTKIKKQATTEQMDRRQATQPLPQEQ